MDATREINWTDRGLQRHFRARRYHLQVGREKLSRESYNSGATTLCTQQSGTHEPTVRSDSRERLRKAWRGAPIFAGDDELQTSHTRGEQR